MTVIYWPVDEYRCDDESRRLGHPDTRHLHCTNDSEVALALMKAGREWEMSKVTQMSVGARYHCVTGPGGLVRKVLP